MDEPALSLPRDEVSSRETVPAAGTPPPVPENRRLHDDDDDKSFTSDLGGGGLPGVHVSRQCRVETDPAPFAEKDLEVQR